MGKLSIAEIIGIMLVTVIGLALVPVVATSSGVASVDPNLSTAGVAMVLLVPLIFVIVLILGIVAHVKSSK